APSGQFHVETGREQRWLTSYGLTADLIVAGRGAAEAGGLRSALETLLIETGRPLLIPSTAMPPTPLIDAIAIGWKPVPQCARALAAAMPLLSRAKQIIVLTVDEGEEVRHDEADRLARNLTWHGLNTIVERLRAGPGGAVDTLFGAATERAGLLVMGGYGH